MLVEVLGTEFNGVLGCDYFSAYRKYMRECDVLVQFCMAHLIRDVKFLLTLPGRDDQAYGQRVRDALRELFAVIHRREKMTAAEFTEFSTPILTASSPEAWASTGQAFSER